METSTKKPQTAALVNLEMRPSGEHLFGRNLMIYVRLPNQAETSLGWYRYDDSENRTEAASLLVRYLIEHCFTGEILLGTVSSNGRRDLTLELFQSELRDIYKCGEIRISNEIEGAKR